MKKLFFTIVVIFLIVGGISIYNIKRYNDFLNYSLPKTTRFRIETGTTSKQLARTIKEKLQLSDIEEFYLLTYFKIHKPSFDAGDYTFLKDTKIPDLIAGFKGGKFDKEYTRVTFLEGWRVEEMALELAKKVDRKFAKEYYTLAKKYEGTLFPETYFIYKDNYTAKDLVTKQVNLYKEKTEDLFKEYDGDLTKEEVVILASIVEREMNIKKERPIIAGILLNRLNTKGWRLDIDATTQYAVFNNRLKSLGIDFSKCLESVTVTQKTKCQNIINNIWAKNLHTEDLNLKSKYNTRLVDGLPPTAISNPSLSSIKAVLNPIKTDYFFYITGKDGKTKYSKTLEKHNINIENHL